jgi:hypothetical protein
MENAIAFSLAILVIGFLLALVGQRRNIIVAGLIMSVGNGLALVTFSDIRPLGKYTILIGLIGLVLISIPN